MTKKQLIHLLEKVPDDATIMIAEHSDYLHNSTELTTIIVEENKRVRYSPPQTSEGNTTLTVYLVQD